MKKLLFSLFCLFFVGAGAWGQTASTLSPQVNSYQFYSRPEHATQRDMARHDYLFENSVNISGHGERPLWEVGLLTESEPLGDVARRYRSEHATAKKAEVVFEN